MKVVKKPWGHEDLFTFNEISTVKIINIKPNKILSLQKHRKRREMWYFLTEGYVVIGNKTKRVKKGEVVKVSKGVKHRIFSKDKEVKVLEISFGKFDWDDIVRLEDKYGREGKRGK